MKLLEALRAGSSGIRVELPAQLAVVKDAEQKAELQDEATGVGWWFFLSPGLHLDLGSPDAGELELAVRWYARAMFDDVFRATASEDAGQPRTADPAWTPMVDFERLNIGGAAALRTVHRMAYRPGREIIMAHLLVPLERGLFEARAVAGESLTGYREALLLDAQPDMLAAAKMLKQADYDDPARDDKFPKHCLSRARAAIRWLVSEAGVKVLAPAPRRSNGEVELAALGCAFVPPPRFVHEPDGDKPGVAAFRRVSFCATDGIEYLEVRRVDELARTAPHELRARIEHFLREEHESAEVGELTLAAEEITVDGRLHVTVSVEGRGHSGALRNSFRSFVDDQRRAWFIAIMASAAVPAEVRSAELEAAARSWRRLLGAASAKPWWRFW